MLNQIVKLGLFITLGIWLKHRGKGLALLILVLGITWVTHNEYLGYIAQSGNTEFLEISYAIKWAIFLIAIFSYYFLVERRIKKIPDADRNTITHPENIDIREDGFDFLRQKKTLESEVDKALKKPGKSR